MYKTELSEQELEYIDAISAKNMVYYFQDELRQIRDGEHPRLTYGAKVRLRQLGLTVKGRNCKGSKVMLTDLCFKALAELEAEG